MELLEGNESFNIIGESYWGNSVYITFFRNNVTGTRRNAGTLGLSDEVLRRIVALDRYSYYHNIVGNVLGAPDIRLQGEQRRFLYEATMDDLLSEELPLPIWLVGHSGEDASIPFDTKVAETLLRHGNYDFVTNSIAWSEGLPTELPASLYLKQKPAFFGDLPWPWVHPESDGRVDVLPAKERFDRIHGP